MCASVHVDPPPSPRNWGGRSLFTHEQPCASVAPASVWLTGRQSLPAANNQQTEYILTCALTRACGYGSSCRVYFRGPARHGVDGRLVPLPSPTATAGGQSQVVPRCCCRLATKPGTTAFCWSVRQSVGRVVVVWRAEACCWQPAVCVSSCGHARPAAHAACSSGGRAHLNFGEGLPACSAQGRH